MPELTFQLRGAGGLRAAIAPAIALRLEVSNSPPSEAIQSVLLNCQVQIEVARRRYTAAEQTRLRDLFGEPERWGETLRPLLWANLTTTVPAFTGSIGIQLVVPCPLDFSLTAMKYFLGVEEGAVPLALLFSGTVFYRNDANRLQTAPIPWSTEARFAMPAGIWKECIDMHHPNTRWLALRRDIFERLYDFKVQHGLATFDEALERLIENALEEVDA